METFFLLSLLLRNKSNKLNFNYKIIKNMINFKSYSFVSVILTVGMIINAIQKHDTFFNTIVFLTSSKINLLIFFNFLLISLINLGNILVWIFFTNIRSIESKVCFYHCNIYFSISLINLKRRYFIFYC